MAYLEKTQISNERDTVINPATEESLILLRRIAKLLESSATSDTANTESCNRRRNIDGSNYSHYSHYSLSSHSNH
jgi:hypothetical protein